MELLVGQGVYENATRVTVRAADGYSRSFSISDLDGGILLVYEKDGNELKGRSEGGDGPIRLIVSQEHAGTFNAQFSVKWVSEVVASLCKGCGTCVAACPAQAITGAHFNNDQILAEMQGLLWDAGSAA